VRKIAPGQSFPGLFGPKNMSIIVRYEPGIFIFFRPLGPTNQSFFQ